MSTLSPLSSPFKIAAFIAAAEDVLENRLIEEEEGTTDNGGLSTWKQLASEDIEDTDDNGGGLSEWKTKRKRNGLKGRTPKHPLNKRPYTC